MKNTLKILSISLALAIIPLISGAQGIPVTPDSVKMKTQSAESVQKQTQEQTRTQTQTQAQNQNQNAGQQQGNIQKNAAGKAVKQVRSARPDFSKAKGARPNITRPSGSGIPKGVGKPGGAGKPGGR